MIWRNLSHYQPGGVRASRRRPKAGGKGGNGSGSSEGGSEPFFSGGTETV